MSEETAIITATAASKSLMLGTINVGGPLALIRQATAVATELAKIIEDKKLYSTIQGRKFVKVEGWSTLGAMLGVLPRELGMPQRLEDGSYVATIQLVRVNDGAVIGQASALVGVDEKDRNGKSTWGSRAEYARWSMALTRATGKAYRLGFSWIMALAGYEPTPAEEMDGDVIEGEFTKPTRAKRPAPVSAPTPKDRPWTPEQVRAFIAQAMDSKSNGHELCSPEQRQLLASKLEECFAGDKDAKPKRYSVTGYLVGQESTGKMTKTEAWAVLTWLLTGHKDDTGDLPLHPNAPAEAAAIVRQCLVDAVEQGLEL